MAKGRSKPIKILFSKWKYCKRKVLARDIAQTTRVYAKQSIRGQTWVEKSNKLMEKDQKSYNQKYLFEFYIFRKFFLNIESEKKFGI